MQQYSAKCVGYVPEKSWLTKQRPYGKLGCHHSPVPNKCESLCAEATNFFECNQIKNCRYIKRNNAGGKPNTNEKL
jgi:hypothetical protein